MGVAKRAVLIDEVPQDIPQPGPHIGRYSILRNLIELSNGLVSLEGTHGPQRVEQRTPPPWIGPRMRQRTVNN
jgi:hypothetical protein